MRHFLFYLVLSLLAPNAYSLQNWISDEEATWFTFIWENDFIVNDDSGYTNGLSFSWGYGPYQDFSQEKLPAWIAALAKYLPDSNKPGKTHALGYQIGQDMYTPADIEREDLIEDDRPYAGLLLWSVNLHTFDQKIADRYRLTLGVVGPASGAEQVQKIIHTAIDVNQPQGWEHQLGNELVFKVSLERLLRLYTHNFIGNTEYDIIGLSAFDAGTLRSEMGAGLGFRFGKELARSFPTASVLPGRNINPLSGSLKHEWHAFLNIYGRYVFNDITIDGNTFKDSHSVTLKNEQALIALGAAYNTATWGVLLSIQGSTQPFEERDENTPFGTFSFTRKW